MKTEIFCIGAILFITILYFLLRKFISWAIEDDDKWTKKHGRLGLHKTTKETNKKIAFDRLTEGYLLIVGILVLIIII